MFIIFLLFKILKFGYKKNNYVIKKIYPGLYPTIAAKTPISYSYDFFTPLSTAGILQLKNFSYDHAVRVKKLKLYEKYLIKNKNLKILKFNKYKENSFLEYPIILKNKTNTYIHKKLLEEGIDLRKKWYLNNLEIRALNKGKIFLNNCYLLSKKILCLPVHKQIGIKEINQICSKINKYA